MLRFRKGWILLILLGLLLAACGGGGGREAAPGGGEAAAPPTPTFTPAPPTPTPTPVPTPTPTPEARSFLSPQEATGLQSYRMRARMTVENRTRGEAIPVMELQVEEVREPPASRVTIRFRSDPEAPMAEMEMVTVGDQIWVRDPEQGTWMMGTGDSAQDFGAYLATEDPEVLIQQYLNRLEKVGTETVSGVKADHYRFETTDPLLLGPFSGPNPATDWISGTWTPLRVQVDLYVAEDGLIVREEILVEGTVATEDGASVDAAYRYEMEVYDLNAPIQIEAPEVTVEAPIPLPPGAQLTMSMGGFQTYTVADRSLEEVEAFFLQELPAQGYEVTKDELTGTLQVKGKGVEITLFLSQEGNQVQINLMGGP